MGSENSLYRLLFLFNDWYIIIRCSWSFNSTLDVLKEKWNDCKEKEKNSALYVIPRPFLKPIFSIVYCRLIFPELGEHLKYLYIYQIWYIIHKMYRCECIFIYSELFVGQTENVVHISEAFLKIRIFFFISSKIKFILIFLFIHRNLDSFRKSFSQANDILLVMKILFALLLCILYFDKKNI